jgi:hypothetical protein
MRAIQSMLRRRAVPGHCLVQISFRGGHIETISVQAGRDEFLRAWGSAYHHGQGVHLRKPDGWIKVYYPRNAVLAVVTPVPETAAPALEATLI